MPSAHRNPVYAYQRCADQDAPTPARHPVVIVGAGPSGLTAAIALAARGQPVVLLDDNDTVSVGSRAICFSKRTLEIWDQYGCAQPMLDKGVQWRLGKVFLRDRRVYEFNLQPEPGHRMPAFINLQQYYVEEALVNHLNGLPGTQLRWRNRVTGIEPYDDSVRLEIETPDGMYCLLADYVIAADGANSEVRGLLKLESEGQIFNDQFLIADIVMRTDFPTERWFWFDPPFHPGQSVLLHRQADNVFRVDFQLGADADPVHEQRPEQIGARLHAMFGADVQWTLEWASVYTFRCRMMQRFVHGRVAFVGDAAHQVSPFGARGANGGVQGVGNLAWKLDRVLRGASPRTLLDSYDHEQQRTARENILHSTRATDFITPKSHVSRVFRDSTLRLAQHHPFARSLVNSGRLSTPCRYDDSTLNTADTESFDAHVRPGAVCPDAPVMRAGRTSWLLDELGRGFTLLGTKASLPAGLDSIDDLTVLELGGDLQDADGLLTKRLDLAAGGAYLIRPDQHICGRWRRVDARTVRSSLRRACACPPD